ncbi:MAG: CHASE2 domain-containing protein [Magnetococcales bacterium]|nr:CHASE2 domain-containing protein [Magnetococcales bacterium]
MKNMRYVLVLGLIVFFLYQDRAKTMQHLENRAYDVGVGLVQRVADDRVVVVAVDQKTVKNLGVSPWSRDRLAEAITILSQGGPKLIVNTIPLLQESVQPKERGVVRVLEFLEKADIQKSISQALPADSPLIETVSANLSKLHQMLASEVKPVDGEQKLLSALEQAENVIQILPLTVANHYLLDQSVRLPDYFMAESGVDLLHLNASFAQPNLVKSINPVSSDLGKRMAGIGFFLHEAEFDGVARKYRLLLSYGGIQLPSLALVAVAKNHNLRLSDLTVSGKKLQIGPLVVAVDSDYQTYPHYFTPLEAGQPFKVFSLSDLLNRQIPADQLYNKMVLIGETDPTISPGVKTPIARTMAPVELLGHRILSLLNQSGYRVLDRAKEFKWLLYAGVGLYLLLLLPLLSRIGGFVTTLFIAALMMTAHVQLMTQLQIWLPMVGPFLLLLSGSLLMIVFQSKAGEIRVVRPTKEIKEDSKRMLGLAFQGQGQLVLAFEKFKSCRMDSMLMTILYDLATEFEQKKQFKQAAEVLSYMVEYKKDFQDIQARLKTMEESIPKEQVVPEPKAEQSESVLSVERYQMGKILGQGSIGTVFLGRAPEDNRQVAVKIIPLTEIFEAAVLEKACKRFAKILKVTKGLNHPNIVNVTQGGERYGQAFFVMDYLPGQSLSTFLEKKNLLPVSLVIQIIAKVAMALDYAHQKGVVHGDLKPSNVLFDQPSRGVKVTNFSLSGLIKMEGGRLVTIRSQATPYHLSPECARGEEADSRSDLFSLGVLFYRMLTGEVPFDEDTRVYSDLETNLSYAPPTSILTFNPDLPHCLDEIITNAIHLNPDKRFQRGAHLARALVNCVKSQVKEST